MIVHGVVEAHEAGLLFVDGKLAERLPPGRHAFWAVGRTVKIQKVDMRPQPLEVTAQEILTKDRVGIRVTLTAFTQGRRSRRRRCWRRAMWPTRSTGWCSSPSARRWRRARSTTSWRRATPSTARSAAS